MAKEKEARRPFNLKKEVKLLPGYIHPAALGNLYHCASGLGDLGRGFPQQQKSSRKSPEV